MTIITKVGASYIDHMNDDTLEVDSFSRRCYQALSSPPILRKEPGDKAGGGGWGSGGMLPQEISTLRLLLRPFWDGSRAVVATWLTV